MAEKVAFTLQSRGLYQIHFWAWKLQNAVICLAHSERWQISTTDKPHKPKFSGNKTDDVSKYGFCDFKPQVQSSLFQ